MAIHPRFGIPTLRIPSAPVGGRGPAASSPPVVPVPVETPVLAAAPTAGERPSCEVAIVIPLSWDFTHKRFTACRDRLERPEGTAVIDVCADTIYKMRNEGVRQARARGARHVLFIDADMTFPPRALKHLLTHGLSIVGGLCRQRRSPFAPVQWVGAPDGWERLDPPLGDRPREVVATGGAFLLVKMEVFDRMEERWPGQPYFICKECLGGFEDLVSEADGFMSEDIFFCQRARELGYQIWVDQGLPIGHLTTAVIIDQYEDGEHKPTAVLEEGVG